MGMKSLERRAPMGARVKHVLGALFGCGLGFGATVTLNDISSPSMAFAPSPAGAVQGKLVLRLTFSKARADSKRRKRTRARRAAARRAQAKARELADKILLGTRSATLPANCVFDSYASISHAVETFVCGGIYYQRFQENGVAGFEGHAVGLDRGAIKRAKARRVEAEKKRRAKAQKKFQTTRRATLSANCFYDSYASTSSATDVFACGAVRYRQYQEKEVTGYEVVEP